MNKICGIYKITSPTSKVYIGQSIDINRRINFYKNARCKKQTKLYYSIIKYGWEMHVFEIIHECQEIKLNDLEAYYIKFYNTFNTEHGLNLTTGGDTFKLSDESKGKISNANMGNKNMLGHHHTDESKFKISNSNKGNKKWLGKKHSEETKVKMSKARIGTKWTENSKLKMKETKKIKNHWIGRKHSEESKMKMSISLKGNTAHLGKKHSEEAKEKISKANKGRIVSEETREKISVGNIGKHHIGHTFSEESKRKISETKKLKNYSGSYEIYNQNNELIYKFKSDIKLELKKLGLPRDMFCNTYKNNNKIKKGKYKDWYMIKL